MPPVRKPADKRQNRVTQDVTLIPVPTAQPPSPPAGLLKPTREKWERFWRSDVSSLVTEADQVALERLFTMYEEWARCIAAARKQGRLAQGGATGKAAVLNPLYSHALTLESKITKLEAEFGLTPLARLKLGVQFGEAQRTLADLNADAEAVDDDPRTSLA